MQNPKRSFVLILLGILGFKMVGFAETATHRPQEFLQKIQGSKNEGEAIRDHFCSSCHAEKPLIPIGAPKYGCNSAWESRFEKGIQQLLQNTFNGLNAMPARGGCFECSDEQLILAIAAMLPIKLKTSFLSTLKPTKEAVSSKK